MTRKQLKLLRLYTGLSQADFAREIGIGKGTLAKIEVGITDITINTKAKVLRKFDLVSDGFQTFCQRMEDEK